MSESKVSIGKALLHIDVKRLCTYRGMMYYVLYESITDFKDIPSAAAVLLSYFE